jgi:hypothetical protein
MKDTWGGQPIRGYPRNSLPCRIILLASTFERSPPEIYDIVPEGAYAFDIGWNRMVRKVAYYHLA